MWVHLQSGHVKFIYEHHRVRARSRAWNVICHAQAYVRAWLQLQWWQVHFSHSRYDANCQRTRTRGVQCCTSTCAQLWCTHLILLLRSWVYVLHIFRSTHKLYNDKHVLSCSWVVCLRWKGDLIIIITVLWLGKLQLLPVQYVVVVWFPNQHAVHRDEGAMWCRLCDRRARVWIQWRRVCTCRLCSSISKLCPVHLDLCCITYSQT